MMATNILQLMFSAADSIVVGRFAGEAQLAAVGAVVPLISLLTNLFLGLSVGANVTAARDFGSEDEDGLSKTLHTALLLGLIVGLFLTGFGLALSERFLVLMQTPDDVLPHAVVYLRIYFLGMASMTIYNFGSAVLRAVGDTSRPLIFLIISGVINVILNLLFVIAFRWGVAGVAISTIPSQPCCSSSALRARPAGSDSASGSSDSAAKRSEASSGSVSPPDSSPRCTRSRTS